MTIKRFALTLGFILAAHSSHARDLMAYYELALEKDPVLKQALAQRNAARENRPIATAQLLPRIDASAASSSVDNILLDNTEFAAIDTAVIRQSIYTLTGQQSIFDFNKWFTLGEANHIVDQADSAYVASEQNLIIRVATAYFDVLNAQDVLTFTQAEKSALEQQLRQAEERFNVGLVAITDLNDFRAQFDESVANEITAQNDMDDAKERLKEIVGQTLIQLDILKDQIPLDTPQPVNIEKWVEFAQGNNPTLASAQYQMDAKRTAVKKERANHFPTVSAVGTYGEGQVGTFINPGNDTDSGWSFTVNAEMNLFAGGGIQANVRKAQYDYEDAREFFEETRRSTISNTRIAYRGVLTSIGQVNAFNQAVISAQSALQANEAAYEVGTKTSIDILDAISRLYNQQRNLASARYNYIVNMLKLKQAAGTLSIADVELVNEWLMAQKGIPLVDDVPCPSEQQA